MAWIPYFFPSLLIFKNECNMQINSVVFQKMLYRPLLQQLLLYQQIHNSLLISYTTATSLTCPVLAGDNCLFLHWKVTKWPNIALELNASQLENWQIEQN